MIRTRFLEIGYQGEKGMAFPFNRKLRIRFGKPSHHLQLLPTSNGMGMGLKGSGAWWDFDRERLVTMIGNPIRRICKRLFPKRKWEREIWPELSWMRDWDGTVEQIQGPCSSHLWDDCIPALCSTMVLAIESQLSQYDRAIHSLQSTDIHTDLFCLWKAPGLGVTFYSTYWTSFTIISMFTIVLCYNCEQYNKVS